MKTKQSKNQTTNTGAAFRRELPEATMTYVAWKKTSMPKQYPFLRPEDIEDIAQECYLQAWREHTRFIDRGTAKLETFLRNVVDTTIVDCIRAMMAKKRSKVELTLDVPVTDVEEGGGGEQYCTRGDMIPDTKEGHPLKESDEKLDSGFLNDIEDARVREVCRMVVEHDAPRRLKDLCVRFNCTESQLKTIFRNAKRILKEKYFTDGENPLAGI